MPSIRTYIEKSLWLAAELFEKGYYAYALLELNKCLVILEDYYYVEEYQETTAKIKAVENRFPKINEMDCNEVVGLMTDLYSRLYTTRHKTVVNDKR